jgi:EF-P beta-lysylation protein EpmB
MPKSALKLHPLAEQGWQQQLAQAITAPRELLRFVCVDEKHFPDCDQADREFTVKVPHSYAAKMQPGDPRDPLLLQVMSRRQELHQVEGYSSDPVGDLRAMPVPGLLHKYHGRVLLVTTGACAVHCRYCFRRHFPYQDNQPARQHWQQALDYIAADDSISEVILSGGDPLVLGDSRLAELLDSLQRIPHIQRLRIHSRLPVVLPARITDTLIALLAGSRLHCSLVIHANHRNEIADADLPILRKLAAAGICLLNQAVLLRDINDSSQCQQALCERLFEARILPYYLHLLDPVQGAAHFDLATDEANHIISHLRQQLPGYLVPKLVRETPGEKSKTPVFGL